MLPRTIPHTCDGDGRRQTGTHRTGRSAAGFTLLEVIVALSVFTIAAAALSYVLIQTSDAQRDVIEERVANNLLHSGLDTVATSPYTDLVEGTFPVPHPCPEGTSSASCLTLEGAQWQINYQSSEGGEGSVTLSGTIFREGEEVGAATRTVPAPDRDTGQTETVVRARLTGDWDELSVLYLVQGEQVVASTPVETSPTVELAVPPGTCADTDPCFLALADSAPFGVEEEGNYTLRPSDLRGEGAAITQEAPGLLDLSADVREVAAVDFQLEARQGESISGTPTTPDTVCVALTFNDGAGGREVVSCNDDDTTPHTLTFSTYIADGWELPLPSGIPLTVTSTPEAGGESCVTTETMLGRVAGSWAPQDLCLDWTWGPVARIEGDGFGGSVETTPLVLQRGERESATLIWSGVESTPAAGFPGEDLWAHPRAALPCGADGTCSPTDPETLEPAVCAGLHCLSAEPSAPGVTLPVWPERTWEIEAGTNSLTVTFDQVDPEPYTVTVTALPDTATITVDTSPLTVGQELLTSPGGEETLTFETDIGPEFEEEETLELTLTGAGRSRTVTLTLESGGL